MTELVDEYRPTGINAGRRNGVVPATAKRPAVSLEAASPDGDRNTSTVGPRVLALPPIEPARDRLHAAWRENTHSRIIDLDVELDCFASRLKREPSLPEQRRLLEAKARLNAADAIVKSRPGPWSAWTGVDVARVFAHINAVEVTLIRLSHPATVAAKLPDIIADASLVLKPNDARLESLREYQNQELKDDNREVIAEDIKAVFAACADEHVKARSFRNILFGATLVLTLFAVAFGILGWRSPEWVGLCVQQRQAVSVPTCPSGHWEPTGGDVFLTELIGLLSASLVGSVAIRRMRGSAMPYAVPMASLLIKLPTGALTAVAGLVLIRAGVLGPDLAQSGTAQLLAYALIFGASQQAFTRLIDIQTQSVLDSIPTRNRDTAKEPSANKQES